MDPTPEQYIITYLEHPSFPWTSPKKDPKITISAKDNEEVKEEPVKEPVQNQTPNQELPEARQTIYPHLSTDLHTTHNST